MPKHGFMLCADYDERKHPSQAIAEIKYDGMMALYENGRFYNRHGRDVTFQFPELRVDPTLVIVGEIVILKDGISKFHLMHKRNIDNPKDIRLKSMLYPATFAVFDVLEIQGQDIQDQTLERRRIVLNQLEKSGLVNDHVMVGGYWGCPKEKVQDLLSLMRDQHAEGIVVKDLNSRYTANRSDGWMKLKAWRTEDYDILRPEVTENGATVIWIVNKGYEQKVVVNDEDLAARIRNGQVKRVTIRFLDEEPSGALRQPHVHGVPWTK